MFGTVLDQKVFEALVHRSMPVDVCQAVIELTCSVSTSRHTRALCDRGYAAIYGVFALVPLPIHQQHAARFRFSSRRLLLPQYVRPAAACDGAEYRTQWDRRSCFRLA